MSIARFNDFSELYRAAFSEPDDQKKLGLLHEVQRIINRYTMESDEKSGIEIEAA